MLLLSTTTEVLRVVTASAVNAIEVHASFVDFIPASDPLPDSKNTKITAAATTTVVNAPGSVGTKRNIKGLYITNNSNANQDVTVQVFDGTNAFEIMQFILLPGENMGYREDGSWVHRDAQGAEYPSAGAGSYGGKTIQFMKSTTAPKAAANWYCSSKDAGFPGAWAPGTPGVNGRVTDGTTAADYGCLPIPNPALGANYITAVELASSVNHTHDFFDVLWVNSGLVVTTTTAQAISSPTLPARDLNGTTNGEGCMIGLLFVAAATNAAAITNTTVSYTNSKGVAGRTATLSAIAGSQIPATPVIGTTIWFNLQAGDTGVRSIQGITLGTSLVTGTISLMITRDIVTIGTSIPNVSVPKAIAKPGIRTYNGSCILHNVLASAATATFISGSVVVTEQ